MSGCEDYWGGHLGWRALTSLLEYPSAILLKYGTFCLEEVEQQQKRRDNKLGKAPDSEGGGGSACQPRDRTKTIT